jgi:tetratricopeptide (TPR) repeat protein
MPSRLNPAPLFARAVELDAAGDLAGAAAAYEYLLSLCPYVADAWYNLGLLRRKLRQYDAALAAYQQALAHGVNAPEQVHLNRGVIFADHLHDAAAAERELLAALQINARYVPALLNLANLHEDRGERNKARALYEKVLTIEPTAWEALARQASLTDVSKPDDVIVAALLNALLRPDVSNAARASLAFALGRALDACGAYDAAFKTYVRANEYSRAAAPAGTPAYDRANYEQLIDQVIAAFPVPRDREGFDTHEAAPLFICGMFRSGSTLVEQVLAAHPRVTAGGELDWLPQLVRTGFAPFPAAAATASSAQLHMAAESYRAARARVFPHADVLTDKRPDNFLYVGIIKSLFPSAKIVHTTRERLDNILSVYFLHLDQRVSYATDLGDIAHYYDQCRRLMQHWRKLYGDDILEFDYDAFVREPQPVLQRLLAHAGLESHDNCLEFYRTPTVVKTASVWQVRRPLYQSSSGRWRNYAKHVGHLEGAASE